MKKRTTSQDQIKHIWTNDGVNIKLWTTNTQVYIYIIFLFLFRKRIYTLYADTIVTVCVTPNFLSKISTAAFPRFCCAPWANFWHAFLRWFRRKDSAASHVWRSKSFLLEIICIIIFFFACVYPVINFSIPMLLERTKLCVLWLLGGAMSSNKLLGIILPLLFSITNVTYVEMRYH